MKDKELIALFETMFDEHWAYEWGAARKGCVDCSGAFVYAYKTFGKEIEHGSNTIGRKRVGKLLPISEAKPGYAAFKWRDDGGEPEKYKGDGIGNLYHIGLVASDGKSVLNAKGTNYGFCCDPLSAWDYVAPLNAVTYTAEDEEPTTILDALYRARVTLNSGTLNVREGPDTGSRRIGKLENRTDVSVVDECGDWCKIAYDGGYAYAHGDYLLRIDDGQRSENFPTESADSGTYVRVTGDKVNIRQGDSTDYGRLAQLAEGTRLEYVATSPTGWHAVRYKKTIAWISDKYSEVILNVD